MRECLICNELCNDSRLSRQEGFWEIKGDPSEGALTVATAKAGIDAGQIRASFPCEDEIPFYSGRQYMPALHLDPNTVHRAIYLKCAV